MKTLTEPSSMDTGIETSTPFLHSERTRIRFGSIAKTSPTLRSWALASSKGFSRRCEAVSAVLIEMRLLRRGQTGRENTPAPTCCSAHHVRDGLRLAASPVTRPRDDTHRVLAA